eukprot:3542764-Lingulodinium_polyedra.AAC.1
MLGKIHDLGALVHRVLRGDAPPTEAVLHWATEAQALWLALRGGTALGLAGHPSAARIAQRCAMPSMAGLGQ